MGERLNKCISALIRPPTVVIGYLADGVYSLLFARAEQRRARTREEQLAQGIRSNLPFLFSDYNAEIIPNGEDITFPPPFDYAVVTVALSGLLVRFLRGRGELAVQLALRDAPKEWHELSLVLNVIDVPEEVKRGATYSLPDAARFLKTYLRQIQEAFSDRYPAVRQRLDEVYSRDRLIIRQWETEINRRLYS